MTALPLLPDAESLGRLSEAMAANPDAPEVPLEPEQPPFPSDGRCPNCRTRLCEWCARIYRLTRQHLKPDGLCPYGHQSETKKENR